MDIFSALRKIFSTGLIVNDIQHQKIRVIDTQRSQAYSRRNTFFDKLQRNQTQQSSMVQNYSLNRISLYRDYDMMDCDALMSSALDVYVFQSLTKDEYGQIMKITAEDQQIVELLTQLFYERLNCQFNFNIWFRNFVKYGDFFLALRIDDQHGIIGCQPISPYDIERVQGEDYNSPDTYFFRMLAGGNQLIDNYNIAHFRLLNDTNFLPYGRSTLQPARRIWKNFSLMVDAMMIQRIMRAPERRVFKVDVGDIPNDEVGQYMTDVINKMKKVPYKDPVTGQINLKYNMQNLLQDFFIPVRGNQDGSTVETLAGMQNSFTDDIAFIKSYMMAALKIPKAFLTFEQGLQGKATLSQLDIIFARYIENLQSLFINQLYRVALIHLFVLGYTDFNDVIFKLQLNNPSNVKKLQDLQLWERKLQIGKKMEQTMHFDLDFIYENIYDRSKQQKLLMQQGIIKDRTFMSKLEQIGQGGQQQGYQEEENQDQQTYEQQTTETQANNQPTQYEQVQATTQETYQQEPLTNKFRGNSPLNLD